MQLDGSEAEARVSQQRNVQRDESDGARDTRNTSQALVLPFENGSGGMLDLSCPLMHLPPEPTILVPSGSTGQLTQGGLGPLQWSMGFRDRVLQAPGILFGHNNSSGPDFANRHLPVAAAPPPPGQAGHPHPLPHSAMEARYQTAVANQVGGFNSFEPPAPPSLPPNAQPPQSQDGDSYDDDEEDEEDHGFGGVHEQGTEAGKAKGAGIRSRRGASLSSPGSPKAKRGRPSNNSGLTLQEKNRRAQQKFRARKKVQVEMEKAMFGALEAENEMLKGRVVRLESALAALTGLPIEVVGERFGANPASAPPVIPMAAVAGSDRGFRHSSGSGHSGVLPRGSGSVLMGGGGGGGGGQAQVHQPELLNLSLSSYPTISQFLQISQQQPQQQQQQQSLQLHQHGLLLAQQHQQPLDLYHLPQDRQLHGDYIHNPRMRELQQAMQYSSGGLQILQPLPPLHGGSLHQLPMQLQAHLQLHSHTHHQGQGQVMTVGPGGLLSTMPPISPTAGAQRPTSDPQSNSFHTSGSASQGSAKHQGPLSAP